MAAAKQHSTLFFERFLAFNLDRFAANPEFLALFTGLTEADVVFGAITRIDAGAKRSTTVNSAGRHFSGIDQVWTPSPAATDLKLYTLANAGAPLASVAELANQTTAGLYGYTDGADTKVGVVIAADVATADQPAAVKAAIQAALNYAIDDGLVTVDADAFTTLLDGDTFNGTLTWAVGSFAIKVIPATDYGTLAAE